MVFHWIYAGYTGTLESCYGSPAEYRKCRAGEGDPGDVICDCYSSHPLIEANYPTDISATGLTSVALIASNTVKSFITTKHDGNSCGGTCTDPGIDDSLEVEMFTGLNGTGTSVGTVWYFHVSNRIADATRNMGYYSSTKGVYYSICKVASGSCGSCSSGPHVHHETSGNCWYTLSCSISCPSYTVGATGLYCFIT